VFNDPVGSIVRLFFGLLDTIIGIVETAAGAIDAVLGSNLAGAVTGFREGMNNWVNEMVGPAKVQIDRMEKLDVLETVNAGAEIGRNLSSFADDFLNGTTNLFGDMGSGFDYDSMYDDGLVVDGGKLDSVGRIEDDVTISDEDIKMLKDIASRDYQVRLTQLTPQLSATFGDIRETADFDKFYDGFVRRGLEDLQTSYILQE
jgi:hypothetical protein